MALQAVPLGLTLAGEQLAPRGAASQLTAPDDVFTCADGLLLGVSVTDDAQWRALAVEIPDLDRPEWGTNPGRLAGAAALTEVLRAAIGAQSRPYWLWRLRAAGIPVGYPLTFDELRTHEQVRRLGQLPTVDTRHWGPVTTGGSPWRFSGHDTRWTAPPLAGEHTAQILDELGVTPP